MSEVRGSDLLREKWQKGGIVINDDLMKRLTAATADFSFVDLWTKGQPKVDSLSALYSVEGEERCGTGVRNIMQLFGKLGVGRAGRVIVFPKGIPVDVYNVQIEIGPTARG